MPQRKFRSDALQELYEEIVGDDPEREAMLEQEMIQVAALASTAEPS
jgi:hypothetical protein